MGLMIPTFSDHDIPRPDKYLKEYHGRMGKYDPEYRNFYDYFFSAPNIATDAAAARYHPQTSKTGAFGYVFFTSDDVEPLEVYSASKQIPDF